MSQLSEDKQKDELDQNGDLDLSRPKTQRNPKTRGDIIRDKDVTSNTLISHEVEQDPNETVVIVNDSEVGDPNINDILPHEDRPQTDATKSPEKKPEKHGNQTLAKERQQGTAGSENALENSWVILIDKTNNNNNNHSDSFVESDSPIDIIGFQNGCDRDGASNEDNPTSQHASSTTEGSTSNNSGNTEALPGKSFNRPSDHTNQQDGHALPNQSETRERNNVDSNVDLGSNSSCAKKGEMLDNAQQCAGGTCNDNATLIAVATSVQPTVIDSATAGHKAIPMLKTCHNAAVLPTEETNDAVQDLPTPTASASQEDSAKSTESIDTMVQSHSSSHYHTIESTSNDIDDLSAKTTTSFDSNIEEHSRYVSVVQNNRESGHNTDTERLTEAMLVMCDEKASSGIDLTCNANATQETNGDVGNNAYTDLDSSLEHLNDLPIQAHNSAQEGHFNTTSESRVVAEPSIAQAHHVVKKPLSQPRSTSKEQGVVDQRCLESIEDNVSLIAELELLLLDTDSEPVVQQDQPKNNSMSLKVRSRKRSIDSVTEEDSITRAEEPLFKKMKTRHNKAPLVPSIANTNEKKMEESDQKGSSKKDEVEKEEDRDQKNCTDVDSGKKIVKKSEKEEEKREQEEKEDELGESLHFHVNYWDTISSVKMTLSRKLLHNVLWTCISCGYYVVLYRSRSVLIVVKLSANEISANEFADWTSTERYEGYYAALLAVFGIELPPAVLKFLGFRS